MVGAILDRQFPPAIETRQWQRAVRDRRADGAARFTAMRAIRETALLRNHAAAIQKQAYFLVLPAQGYQPTTEWVLISANSRFAEQTLIRQATRPWPTADNPALMWTDSYSNLLQLLK